MKTFSARKLAPLLGISLLNHAHPMQHPRLTMVLLALDVILGVSILDALFDMDLHVDAALDLAEAGLLSVRTHQGCGTENWTRAGKLTLAG